MNKWKLGFGLCLTLLILISTVLMYVIIDQAVTISYFEQTINQQAESNAVIADLLVKESAEYSQKDFLYLLRQAYPDGFIVEEGNAIFIERNEFIFLNGKLSSAK